MRLPFGRKKEKQADPTILEETLPRPPLPKRLWRSIVRFPIVLRDSFWRLFTFLVLLLFYVGIRVVFSIIHRTRKLFRKGKGSESREILFARFSAGFFRFFRSSRSETIDKVSLIEVAVRNMRVKKTRTAITVGGMALGIGSIVFLVSIGYGLQNLVISQVARLEEMKQADVSPQAGGKIHIDDKTLSNFSEVTDVQLVAPLVAVVGRVNYQNSVSDMAAYGVTSDYLVQSALQPVAGRFFESNDLSASVTPKDKAVLGISDEKDPVVTDVPSGSMNGYHVSSTAKDWVRIRTAPNADAETVGYAKIVGDPISVEGTDGAAYRSTTDFGRREDADGMEYGVWGRGEFEIWKAVGCKSDDTGCEDGFRQVMDKKTGKPTLGTGYFAFASDTLAVVSDGAGSARVLGESVDAAVGTTTADTAATTVAATDVPTTDEWAGMLTSEETGIPSTDSEKVTLGDAAKREAVVNRAALRVLSIDEAEAVGKTFSVSFVVTGNLLDGKDRKVESIPSDYVIVGVIPDDKTPMFYIPFVDLRTIGISNYSQVKLAVVAPEALESVRRKIESMGYATSSVADTVEQINSFFSTARIVLGLLGMAALGVAALGMFNTLTVSLLERTREVGLMKAMGMKSSEVQELFLTESMVMSFFGGVIGLLFGWGAGKLLGFGISALAMVQDRGLGFLDVSYIPPSFIAAILVFSAVVGIVTGLYPAYRATKISALNALRYE
jgi:ABC-type antimicrobial peptide transport system permease subunit